MQQNSNTNMSYYQGYKYSSIQRLQHFGNMYGVKRVLLFCVMMALLPSALIITPLYLRHMVYADTAYQVAESDVVAIINGISSVFCASQSLRMNSTFNAFQLHNSPALSPRRKHLRLKKSMTLPDDTLEYWGFYLLTGATVSAKVCARYPGSRLLVVRGEKNLNTCGLMDHNLKKVGAHLDKDYTDVKVQVFFEQAEEMEPGNSSETLPVKPASVKELPVNEFVKKRLNKAKNKTIATTQSTRLAEEEMQLVEDPPPLNPTNLNKKQRIQAEIERLQAQLNDDYVDDDGEVDVDTEAPREHRRRRRDINQILDGGIEHGGNAINYSLRDSTPNSVSSFEEDLLTCYDGSILLAQGFDPSDMCTSVHVLEDGTHMQTVHEVASDGYYYYIFYSDNDIENNVIHAVFDVMKPTFQYMNNSKEKECINVTECRFPITFLSDETVVVEVPTHDGIEVDEDHVDLLVSTCHPRMGIYIIFPLSVMILILACGFL